MYAIAILKECTNKKYCIIADKVLTDATKQTTISLRRCAYNKKEGPKKNCLEE